MPTRTTRAEQIVNLLRTNQKHGGTGIERDDLAQALGIRPGSVRSLITKARRLLEGDKTGDQIFTNTSSDGLISWCYYSLEVLAGQRRFEI